MPGKLPGYSYTTWDALTSHPERYQPKASLPDTREFQVNPKTDENGEAKGDIEFKMDTSDLSAEEADKLADNVALRLAKQYNCQVRWNRGPLERGKGQGHYCDPVHGVMS